MLTSVTPGALLGEALNELNETLEQMTTDEIRAEIGQKGARELISLLERVPLGREADDPRILRLLFDAVVNGAAAYAENCGPLDAGQIVREALIAFDDGSVSDQRFDAAMAIYNECS